MLIYACDCEIFWHWEGPPLDEKSGTGKPRPLGFQSTDSDYLNSLSINTRDHNRIYHDKFSCHGVNLGSGKIPKICRRPLAKIPDLVKNRNKFREKYIDLCM